MRRWIEDAAARYDLPTAVIEEIYASQAKFLREHLTDRDPAKLKSVHVRGLGKLYIRPDKIKRKYEQASGDN